jgi:hypothetical protein
MQHSGMVLAAKLAANIPQRSRRQLFHNVHRPGRSVRLHEKTEAVCY